MLNGYVSDFAYAAKAGDTDYATEVYLQNGPPHGHFSYLSLNIEEMFVTGEPQYPVERTLLVDGDPWMHLCTREQKGHIRIETPHLAGLSYRSYEKMPIRPVAPRPEGGDVRRITLRGISEFIGKSPSNSTGVTM